MRARQLVRFAVLVALACFARKAVAQRHSVKSDAVSALVIGGNFTLNGKVTNLAQYNTKTHTWYTRFEPQVQ